MADYYPLIDKAVSGLEKSTGEARRALYERARTALVAQLRAVTPALSEPDIRRERLALEEAVRKVEAEAARRSRNDPPPPPPKSPPPRREQKGPARRQDLAASLPQQKTPSPPPPPVEEAPPPEPTPRPATRAPRPVAPNIAAAARPASALSAAAIAPVLRAADENPIETRSPGEVAEPPRVERTRWTPGGGPSISDKGLKGFRDVVAEAETLGDATAQAAKSVRAALALPGGTAVRAESRNAPRGGRRAERRDTPRLDGRPEPRDDLRLGGYADPLDEPQVEADTPRFSPRRPSPRDEPQVEPDTPQLSSRRPSPRDAARMLGRESFADPAREPAAEPDREAREPRRSRAAEAQRPAARRTEPPPPPISEPDDLPADAIETDGSDFDTSFRPEFPTRPPTSTVRQEDVRARMPTRLKPAREERDRPAAVKRPPGQWKQAAAIAIAVLLALTVVGLGVWKAPSLIASFRGAPTRDRPADAADAGPKIKITERAPSSPYTAQSASDAAPVAQRVVLYEEDPADPNGKRFAGSAVWRIDRMPPSPGQKPEVAIRADIEVPEQRMSMRWSLRRNDDNGAASHTIEVMFTLPPDFPHGSISNIPGVLMKESEASRGTPLAGLVVKVTNNFFLIGLSSADADMQRNVQLLKQRGWFDVPVVYGDGKRAIIAIEKGTPGDRAFADAFAAWGQ
jgi:hypothetical protein